VGTLNVQQPSRQVLLFVFRKGSLKPEPADERKVKIDQYRAINAVPAIVLISHQIDFFHRHDGYNSVNS
jgi:hypothetical protein